MIISFQVLDKALKEKIRHYQTIRQPASSKGEEETKPHWKWLISMANRCASTVKSGVPASQSREQLCHCLFTFRCLLITCRYSKLHAGTGSSRSDFGCYRCPHCFQTKIQAATTASECFYFGFFFFFFPSKSSKDK